MLSLKLWNTELIKKKYQSERSLESEEFAEDLLNELFDEFYDMREKIIELKKENLNESYLEDITNKVLEKLEQKGVDDGLIEALDFEFIDHLNGRNSKLADDWGFPTIGLRITDYESIEYFHPIDVYKDPLVLDDKIISDELLKRIR